MNKVQAGFAVGEFARIPRVFRFSQQVLQMSPDRKAQIYAGSE